MVNTFVPYADFTKSAKALDNKRLGKQRVEAWQILRVLIGATNKGWKNHPATNMWRGHEKALCDYGIAICQEWVSRGYKDSLLCQFVALHSKFEDTGLPFWVGNDELHNSHKSNLQRKNPDYYQFNMPTNVPYLWANATTKEMKWGTNPNENKNKKKGKTK